MSYFAKVLDGKVLKVFVAEKEFFNTYIDDIPGEWIETMPNTYGNIHYNEDGSIDSEPAMRGNYACIGYIYDRQNDVFYEPQPYPSWTLNNATWIWEAPIAAPTDGKLYDWDESNKSWIEATI
jgi:hypothetical protein